MCYPVVMRRIILAPGEIYHIYNRGVEKRKIFLKEADYKRFLALLYVCNGTKSAHLATQGTSLEKVGNVERGEPLVDIAAYCLMPNHFHLIVKEKDTGGISRFMQKLTTGYTMYFNTRTDRTGALLQGTYKAAHAKDDRYLKYLISYVHLNPVKLIEPKWKENKIKNKKRAKQFLDEYQHSSYPDYSGRKRVENCILNTAALPDYFGTPRNFKASVTEWLSYEV